MVFFRLIIAFVILGCFLLVNETRAMTKQQLKNSGKLMKKTCMPKNDVTEDQIGEIVNGKFLEEKNVMCYISCVFGMMQGIKNGKLNIDAVVKQVDMMFPPEMKEPFKASVEKCRDAGKKYKDIICEAAFWTTKRIYDNDPETFFFP